MQKRHRHQEFLQFLKHIEANVPKKLEIHLVVDNYATHKHAKIRNWLAARPRYHIHYTPTYSSWLNQVETWFNIITQKAIRRGSFRSTKQLREKIDEFVKNYNKKHDHLYGQQQPIQFWLKSNEFMKLFLGHNTSLRIFL